MKARISAPLPKVAVGVNVAEEKAAVIREAMERVGGKYLAAPNDCGADTVSYICGHKGCTAAEQRLVTDKELLIFSGLDTKELNSAVTAISSKGVKIPLKAMLTPHNKDWTISALAGELAAEHEYMTNRGKGESNDQEKI